MNQIKYLPYHLDDIEEATRDIGFAMPSDYETGSILRTLAASKTSGKFLELGTGTGLSTAWILDGMDKNSELTTNDNDPAVMSIAERFLGKDSRVEFITMDGSELLKSVCGNKYDFIFADTWPGKYWDLDIALSLLKEGGIYIIDDMLPQKNWPEGHADKVEALLADLEANQNLKITKLSWSTGIVIAVRIP